MADVRPSDTLPGSTYRSLNLGQTVNFWHEEHLSATSWGAVENNSGGYVSQGLFEYRQRKLLAQLRRNRRIGAWAATLLTVGCVGFVMSRFAAEGSTVYLALGIGGVVTAAMGVVAFAVAAGGWKPTDKCPSCGELFWGSKSQSNIGFRTLTSKCMFCGHALTPGGDDQTS